MTDDLRSALDVLRDLPDAAKTEAMAQFSPKYLAALVGAAQLIVRPAQLPPDGDWTIWLLLAGRGFGKTWAGAAWVDACGRSAIRSPPSTISPASSSASRTPGNGS